MNFGRAIEALKREECVQREGWNGKGMFIYIEDRLSCPRKNGVFGNEDIKYDPCIVIFTAQKIHQPGWNASTADVLAEDWKIVPLEYVIQND